MKISSNLMIFCQMNLLVLYSSIYLTICVLVYKTLSNRCLYCRRFYCLKYCNYDDLIIIFMAATFIWIMTYINFYPFRRSTGQQLTLNERNNIINVN